MGADFHGRTNGGSAETRICLPNKVHHTGCTCDLAALEDTEAATMASQASLAFITAEACAGLDSRVLMELGVVEQGHNPGL